MITKLPHNMKCILCNSDNFNIISKKLRNNIKRNVVECSSCKLVSLENPTKNIIDYDKNYRKLHSPIIGKQLSAKEFFDYELPFQKSRIKRIKSMLNQNLDVLEIGCSTGHFLYSIKDDVKSLTGIELDKKYAEFARNVSNFTIYDKPIEKINFNGKKFDIIFLFQVFEHIDNPQNFLHEIKKHLKDSGIIYLEVPNIDDALYSIYNLNSYKEFYFRLPHVYYYSSFTLEKMLEFCGFVGKIGYHQDFSFFNHLHWLQNGTPQKNQKIATEITSWYGNNDVQLPTSQVVKNWLSKIDQEYKKILCENGISEILSFTGKKNNP